MTTPIQILHRRDTAANWTAANPVLGSSEHGHETDTKKFKFGDGTTAWNSLAYFEAGAGDVVGPATATDNAIARFDQGTGDLIQNSLMTVDDAGSPNIPSGQSYKKNSVALAYGDVGAAASSHTHGGGDITSQVGDANTVDGEHASAFADASHTHGGGDVTSAVANATDADTVDGSHAAAFAASSHNHAATAITSGSLDGDRLAAPTTTKRGGVKETGTPSGKFLRDDDSWAAAGGAYRRPATIVVAASDSKDTTNADFVCPATDALDCITTTVIPALPAGGGGILFLEGNYPMTTSNKGIVIDRNNVTLEGMGQSTIFKFPANTVTGTLITCNYANCAFDNFQLKGVATGSAAQIGISSGSALCVLSRLDINGFGPDGSSQGITGSGSVIVEECYIHGNYYGVQGSFNLATVTGCYLYGNTRPLYIGGNYITLSNNLIEASTYGSYTYSGPGIGAQISGNIFNQLYGRCITHTGGKASITSNMFYITSLTYPAITASGSGLTITGNAVTSDGSGDPGAAPFSIDAGVNSIISGNTYNAAGAARCGYGLQIGSSAVGCVVMRNALCFTVAPILDAGTQTIFGDAEMTSLLNVLAEDVDAIVDNEDLNVSLPLTCTLDGQPDFGRNVTLALTDADDSISAINITVKGMTSLGVIVTETFTFASFTAKVATGNYPFETITEVKVNSATGIGAGDILEVGIGKKLGLPGRIHDTGSIIWVKQNAAKTAAYTASATYGTIAPTTLTAADDFDIFWIRNTNTWAV
jgi:hypothetical protein